MAMRLKKQHHDVAQSSIGPSFSPVVRTESLWNTQTALDKKHQ